MRQQRKRGPLREKKQAAFLLLRLRRSCKYLQRGLRERGG